MHKFSKTFNAFVRECSISKEKGAEIVAQAFDQVNFCENVYRDYGVNYTLQQAAEIYATAPLDD
jgi:hypothetical protein